MTVTTSHTHTTVTTPVVQADPSVPSIRQIIVRGLLAGTPTKEIAAKVVEFHPTSAAAAKSAKHIAWYKADMKKNPASYKGFTA